MALLASDASWNIILHIPVGGNPNSPVITDPDGPIVWMTKEIDGVDVLVFDPDIVVAASLIHSPGPYLSPAPAAGAAVGGYSDWYVNRVWIDPIPIEFGSIVSTVEVIVTILNTFRYEDRILSSIDVSALGVGVSVLVDPSPVTLLPFEQTSTTLEATSDGPSSFDDDVDFEFDTGTVSVQATGVRLILFWYEPEQPMRESMGWVTDILRTRDGLEQRDSLRTTPRQSFQFRLNSDSLAETTRVRTLLLAFRSSIFGIPIWPEQRKVTAGLLTGGTVIPVDTTDIDHREGGTIMVWEPATRTFFDAEIATSGIAAGSLTITTATTVDITTDAIILPVRFGHIRGNPQYNDRVVGIQQTIVNFETTDNVDLSFADQTALEVEFPVHPEDSLPVLSDPNAMTSQLQRRTQETRFATIDNDIGVLLLSATDPLGTLDSQKGTVFRDLAELRKWRSFLHFVRGSWGSFYLPTFRNDFTVTIDFALNAGSITVENTQLANLFGIQEPHRSLMLELPDGSQFFARINTVTEIDDDTESLSLVSPFDAAATVITAADAKLSWLELVRIDGDEATIVHSFAGDGAIRFTTRTIQQ